MPLLHVQPKSDAAPGQGFEPTSFTWHIAVGREVETQVLARAIAWHSEHRVELGNNHTIVVR